VILQFDLERRRLALFLHFRVAADETFGFQHVENAPAQLGRRRRNFRKSPQLTVADACNQIAKWIVDGHRMKAPPTS